MQNSHFPLGIRIPPVHSVNKFLKSIMEVIVCHLLSHVSLDDIYQISAFKMRGGSIAKIQLLQLPLTSASSDLIWFYFKKVLISSFTFIIRKWYII